MRHVYNEVALVTNYFEGVKHFATKAFKCTRHPSVGPFQSERRFPRNVVRPKRRHSDRILRTCDVANPLDPFSLLVYSDNTS